MRGRAGHRADLSRIWDFVILADSPWASSLSSLSFFPVSSLSNRIIITTFQGYWSD